MIESHKIVDSLRHEGVTLLCEDEVVGDADRIGYGKNDGVGEKGINRADTSNVEVHVNTAVMIEDEVPNDVCTLNRIGVAVKSVKEPWILLSDELP